MRVVIAGSRGIWSIPTVEDAISKSGFSITEVVSGGCRGVDEIGEAYAASNNIPCKVFIADWGKHGRSAGPIRNAEMAVYADALIAVWDGHSRGTLSMINEAKRNGLEIYIHRTTD